MREYTKHDLFRLTRDELIRLDHQMVLAIAQLPALHEDRTLAILNQLRIRRELGRREYELGL